MEKRVFVKGEGHDIPMVIVYPEEGNKKYPALLLLHGMLSYKEGDGYLLRKVAEKLQANGIASARIDFCSMGENRGSRKDYGMKEMLKETAVSFKYLQQDPLIDPERIGLLGHSLGGRVAFMSSELPVKCLVSLNGAINVTGEMIRKYDRKRLEEVGYEVRDTSDGRCELLFKRFYDELKECLSDKVYSFTNPILVCVGKNDPTLDPQISYSFVKDCGTSNVDLLEIEDANHTFNAKTGDYTKVYELCDKMNRWLDEHLVK